MATLFSRSSSAKYFFATSQSSSASDTGTAYQSPLADGKNDA
jgi:hypothetical protein